MKEGGYCLKKMCTPTRYFLNVLKEYKYLKTSGSKCT